MGKKKPSKSTPKTPKHEKKPQIHNLNKIIPPKVFITESSNFKNLVQELTGNGNSQIPSPAPLPSPPTRTPDQENSLEMSFDSSCFSTPLESSPDCFHQDLSSQYLDLEALLMGIDSVSNNYGVDMIQQEVCFYDYDISSFMWSMHTYVCIYVCIYIYVLIKCLVHGCWYSSYILLFIYIHIARKLM